MKLTDHQRSEMLIALKCSNDELNLVLSELNADQCDLIIARNKGEIRKAQSTLKRLASPFADTRLMMWVIDQIGIHRAERALQQCQKLMREDDGMSANRSSHSD